MAGPYARHMFNFLKTARIIFQNGSTVSCSCQQCVRVVVATYPCQRGTAGLSILVIVVYAVVPHSGFNLAFPKDGDIKYLFMCPLAIYISSLIKCLVRSFVHFLICSLITEF